MQQCSSTKILGLIVTGNLRDSLAIVEETEVSFCYEKCFCEEQNRGKKVTATEYLMGTLIFY